MYGNTALVPQKSADELLPDISKPVAVVSSKFQTSWKEICLVPGRDLKECDPPEPEPWGTAVTNMPVIRVSYIKYVGFLRVAREASSLTQYMVFSDWFVSAMIRTV